jgi:hypothetical protein
MRLPRTLLTAALLPVLGACAGHVDRIEAAQSSSSGVHQGPSPASRSAGSSSQAHFLNKTTLSVPLSLGSASCPATPGAAKVRDRRTLEITVVLRKAAGALCTSDLRIGRKTFQVDPSSIDEQRQVLVLVNYTYPFAPRLDHVVSVIAPPLS